MATAALPDYCLHCAQLKLSHGCCQLAPCSVLGSMFCTVAPPSCNAAVESAGCPAKLMVCVEDCSQLDGMLAQSEPALVACVCATAVNLVSLLPLCTSITVSAALSTAFDLSVWLPLLPTVARLAAFRAWTGPQPFPAGALPCICA